MSKLLAGIALAVAFGWVIFGIAAARCGGATSAHQPAAAAQRFHVTYSQHVNDVVGEIYVICDTHDHQLLYVTSRGMAAQPTTGTITDGEC